MSDRIGVALSGGGHRASLFAVGVLQYLADAGVNREVTSIASVSGGSLTNAFVGQQVDYRSVDGPTFQDRVTQPLLRQIALDGTLFATRRSKLYLLALILIAGGGLIVPWFLDVRWYLRLAWFLVGLLVLGALAGLRGRVCAAAFRDTLFSPDGRPSTLAALDRPVDHVLCATDLRSGDHVYFSGQLVYGYRFGVGEPGDLDLGVAAHASAALPGAFPPVRLPTSPHRFRDRPPTPGLDEDPSQLVLVDGGVYDNMADQWGSGHRDREARLPERFTDRWPTVLVVANASSGMTWAPFSWSRVPILNEVLALLRDKSILYDNTTAHRRRALIERFDQAEQLGEGQRGVYVGIEQSPYRVAERLRDARGWPGRAERARRVIALLDAAGRSSAEWQKTARTSAAASTNLSRVDVDAASALVHHAYVTAMCNLHVVLDLPLLDVPPEERFRSLVSSR